MSDHVHLVVQGLSQQADLRRLVSRWKQATGYHDHVLRGDDPTLDFVRYVVENPVKAGMAAVIGDYLFAGSDVLSMQELVEVLEQA